MNNIDVFNPNNRPKVKQWLNDVAKFNNSNSQYNRLSTDYESIRDMINKNGPSNTMSRVNNAFTSLNARYKTKKGGKKVNKRKRNTRRSK